MTSIEGKLCQVCIETFQGMTMSVVVQETKRQQIDRNGKSLDRIHHQNQSSLVTSKDDGCFICSWLWAKIPPVLRSEEFESSPVRTFCQVAYAFSGSAEIQAHFYSRGPWDGGLELRVSLCQADQLQHRHSPHPFWSGLQELPWLKVDAALGSGQDLGAVTAWLSTCQTQHGHCVAFSSQHDNSFFPTRVLDVAKAALGTVCLRDRADVVAKSSSEYPPYWTLSHRWGNNNNILQLRKESERGFRDGISTQDLSPAFRDAVLLVHRLGYQYIWIDSLCIFQDLLADWQTEAAAMVDVYRNSLCNISAVAASYDPACVGLFNKRRLPPRMLFPFVADMEIHMGVSPTEGKVVSGKWMVYCQSPWEDEIESTPISRRGWVVQERFLAPRVLHFTRNQIYWECLEASHAATHPKTNLSFLEYDTSFRSGYKTTGLELSKARAASESDPNRRLYHIHWGTIVSKYVACLLTKESDRLLAMTGIAKVFQEVNRDAYLAGLWRKTVHADLGWTTEASSGVPAYRSTELRAPSWSWASIVGGNVRLYLRTPRADLPFPTIKVVDARIVPERDDGDSMGLLKSAELEIDCVLQHYLWRRAAKSLTVFERGSTTVPIGMTLQLALDTSDVVEKFDNAEEIRGVCVPVNGSNIKYGGGENKFLVLEHEADQRYRRVGLITGSGIASFLSEHHIHHMDTIRITLI